jgi:hypothetical protein
MSALKNLVAMKQKNLAGILISTGTTISQKKSFNYEEVGL